MSIRVLGAILTALGLLLTSHHATAGGFYISELGTPGTLGTAGAANTTNTVAADSAFTNPAGMTGLEKDTILGGMQLVLPWIEFSPSIATAGGNDGGNAGKVAVVPSLFAVKRISDRARLGFSMTGPLGGGLDYGDNFVGRYSATKSVMAGLAMSPSVGFKVNDRLSVGAGLSLLYTTFEEDISVRQPGGVGDGRIKLSKLDGWGVQGFFGTTFELTDRALVGVVYRTESDVDIKGDLNFNNVVLPIPRPDKIKIEWDNPQLLEVGLKYKLTDDVILVANADWEDWSQFSDNQVAVSGGGVATIDRN